MIMAVESGDVQELRRKLDEAEETLRAIRSGEVDALVVNGPDGEQVYTLQGADHSYRVMIEAMQQGAASLSSSGVVLYCNRSFADMVQWPHEKVIGANVTEFLPHPYWLSFEVMLRQAHSRVCRGELNFQLSDESLRPVQIVLNPVTLIDGQAVCMIATDLTEQKKHENLQDINRRKDEFLAMLAHELRNPLAPILNAVALLNHLSPRDEAQKYASDVIERQSRHLSRLVDDLLDVSRISLGKVKLRKERLELADIIARAVETSRPLIESRGHRFRLNLPSPGVFLEADPTRLSQVISNLLTNAAKYTPEKGDLSLSVERDGTDVLIRVQDNGMGIPPELLPHVFDLFIQGDRSLARSEGGLGIGLTLVNRLVQLHDGTVEAFSGGSGNGSEFVVRLPALVDESPSCSCSSHQTSDLARRTGRSILVVEDNKDGADSLALLLRMMGHQVTLAYNGSEALEIAKSICPQVVLLDIGLPEMSGYDVARKLRCLPGYESTLLVAMTGYGQEEDKQRSREAGFHHHLVKPVDLQMVVGLLETLSHTGS